MFYYHIWVRSGQYHGHEALTYESSIRIQIGAVVKVYLRNEKVLGIIVAEVARPSFSTKPIDSILKLPPLPNATLKLSIWMQQFYYAPLGSIAQQLLPSTLTKQGLKRFVPLDVSSPPRNTTKEPPLTKEQQAALATIQKPETYLLHGRTGSGKTRIYLELAKRTLDQGRSALILTPEIGLTSQLASQFRKLFGTHVVVAHSQLTARERLNIWMTLIQSRSPMIIVGARSALFSPLANIGLIVVDEAHDTAYKQEQQPHYHAVRVASQLRNLHKATLVLGSATPAITDYYLAIAKKKPILRLKTTAIKQDFKHTVKIVDLRDRSLLSTSSHLSKPLLNAVAHSLEKGEQALLYLNRRGTARVTLCQQCGWQALCPHCDLPLTYHGDQHMVRCHVCGHKAPPPTTCPNCANTSLLLQSFGTKAIVEEIQRIFPEAHVLRFDTDNLKSERLEHQYENIQKGDIDILVGTQMLTKGLDLPRLGTLGIIMAESSMYIPDFTAQERTYQLLTQVLGRVGRGHIDSQAIVQTYDPSSLVLEATLTDNWQTFYNNEIEQRRKYNFPPFCHLLKLTCRRASSASAEKSSLKLKTHLESLNPNLCIEGPAPSFHERVSKYHQWQLTVKASNRGELLAILPELPKAGWQYDIDPIDLL